MEQPITFVHFALFLLEALVLGAVIGAERQWRQRTAGLRANASCLQELPPSSWFLC